MPALEPVPRLDRGNPILARFIQPDWWDPTDPKVGTNRYAYGLNNPILHKDPSGHFIQGLVGELAKRAIVSGIAMIAAILAAPDEVVVTQNSSSTPGIGHNGGPKSTPKDFGFEPGAPGPHNRAAAAALAIAAGELASNKGNSGLTNAGHAYQKHMPLPNSKRANSTYDRVPMNAPSLNNTGIEKIREIVNNPSSTISVNSKGGVTITAPNGQGVHIRADGTFGGFRDITTSPEGPSNSSAGGATSTGETDVDNETDGVSGDGYGGRRGGGAGPGPGSRDYGSDPYD